MNYIHDDNQIVGGLRTRSTRSCFITSRDALAFVHDSSFSRRKKTYVSKDIATFFDEAKIALIEVAQYAAEIDRNHGASSDLATNYRHKLGSISEIRLIHPKGTAFNLGTVYNSLAIDVMHLQAGKNTAYDTNRPEQDDIHRSSEIASYSILRDIEFYFPLVR